MITTLDDHELCRRLAKKNSEAVDEVVRRYTDMVYRVCLRVLKNSGDAEDVVQNVFLRFIEKAPTFDKNVILEAWLYRAAIFSARDQRSKNIKRSHRERGSEGMESIESDRFTITEDLEKKQMSGLIDHAISQLPERYRDVILMHFIGGKKKSDVAESLGLKRSTLSMRLSKGLDKLRDNLSRAGVSTSVSAITIFLNESLALPVPSTLKMALQKKLHHFTRDSSTSLTPIQQTHSSASPFLSKPIVALLALSLALVSAVGYHYAFRDSLSSEAKPNGITTVTDSSDGINLDCLFRDGPSDDLLLKSGSWEWKPGKGKAGEMVVSQRVFIQLNKTIPRQPLYFSVKIQIFSGDEAFWSVGWCNDQDGWAGKSSKFKPTISKTGLMNVEIYFYEQFSLFKTDGKVTGMVKYKKPYPSDCLGFTLTKTNLQELHVKTIPESELPKILKNPALFEKEFLKF